MLLLSVPVTIVMRQDLPAAVLMIYWAGAFAAGLACIAPPYLLVRRYLRLRPAWQGLAILFAVFVWSGGLSVVIDKRVGQAWLAIALFASGSALVLLKIIGRAERKSITN